MGVHRDLNTIFRLWYILYYHLTHLAPNLVTLESEASGDFLSHDFTNSKRVHGSLLPLGPRVWTQLTGTLSGSLGL